MNYSMKLEWYGCNQKWYRALNGACSLFLYEMMRWPRTLLCVLFELEAMAMYLNYLFFHTFLLPQRVGGKKKFRKSFAKKLVLKLITIVWLRFWWCRYCRSCRCRFWRRIIRRIKSINLITTVVAAAAVVINAILLQLLRWYWTTRTNVLTFYCNIIDRRNWRNLWKSQKAIMRQSNKKNWIQNKFTKCYLK